MCGAGKEDQRVLPLAGSRLAQVGPGRRVIAVAPAACSPGDWFDLNLEIARSLQRRPSGGFGPLGTAWALPFWKPPRGGPSLPVAQKGLRAGVGGVTARTWAAACAEAGRIACSTPSRSAEVGEDEEERTDESGEAGETMSASAGRTCRREGSADTSAHAQPCGLGVPRAEPAAAGAAGSFRSRALVLVQSQRPKEQGR